jgi:hypothetical protein
LMNSKANRLWGRDPPVYCNLLSSCDRTSEQKSRCRVVGFAIGPDRLTGSSPVSLFTGALIADFFEAVFDAINDSRVEQMDRMEQMWNGLADEKRVFTRNHGRPLGARDTFDPREVAAYKAEPERYPIHVALYKALDPLQFRT